MFYSYPIQVEHHSAYLEPFHMHSFLFYSDYNLYMININNIQYFNST